MTMAETKDCARVCTQQMGGVFGAFMATEDGSIDVLIVSPQETEFVAYSRLAHKGAVNSFNGLTNTHALADAGSEAARCVLEMKTGEFSDWYVPTRLEFLALYLHNPTLFPQQWYLTSTQDKCNAPWLQGTGRGSQVEGSNTSLVCVRAIRRTTKAEFDAQIQGATA